MRSGARRSQQCRRGVRNDGAAPGIERGRRRVEIGISFTGRALNAVDAKGRVSLPANFRLTIERKLQRVTPADGVAPAKAVMIGPHERYAALHAFDAPYLDRLQVELEKRVADLPAAEQLAALEDELGAFSTVEEVGFDGNGRMVLPAGLRRRAAIGELAYFRAAATTFQIWDPDRFREAFAHDQRQIDLLDDLIADRAARGRG